MSRLRIFSSLLGAILFLATGWGIEEAASSDPVDPAPDLQREVTETGIAVIVKIVTVLLLLGVMLLLKAALRRKVSRNLERGPKPWEKPAGKR